MTSFFADLHCHPTLRPFNMKDPKVNIWSEIKPDGTPGDEPMCRYSQCDFSKLAKGNVKIVFASLYPIEQGFFDIKLLGTSDITDSLIYKFLDFPKPRVSQVQAYTHDYFYDLNTEYKYLLKQENRICKIPGYPDYKFKIVKNYNEIKDLFGIDDSFNVTRPDEPTIAVVLTIEGGHSLGCGAYKNNHVVPNDLNNPQTKLILRYLKGNIKKIKNWKNGEHSPLFITFSHHFWNQLCGNTVSFYKTAHWIFDQADDANPDFNAPLTRLGEEVIKELLNNNGTRRILIDTKHMTVSAKSWFYSYLQQNNIRIPIISSHSAVNNVKNIADSHSENGNHHDADRKYRDSKTFNSWDINLTDQEILTIYDSGGIIGINFDERILMGYELNENIKSLINDDTDAGKINSLWTEPFVDNILHIARVISNNKGISDDTLWNHICIGSDFDGIINPVDAYRTVEQYNILGELLKDKLKGLRTMETLLQNKTDQQIEEIVEGFKYRNVLRFLSSCYS